MFCVSLHSCTAAPGCQTAIMHILVLSLQIITANDIVNIIFADYLLSIIQLLLSLLCIIKVLTLWLGQVTLIVNK